MAGVKDPNVVDVVSLDPQTDQCVLVAVEDRPWSSPSILVQLQQKMEFYLTFALYGELVAKFPEANGKGVRIRLECAFSPPLDARAVLQRLHQALQTHGVGFEVRVWPDNTGEAS